MAVRRQRRGYSVAVSGVDGALIGEIAHYELRLPPRAGRLRSRFYQLQAIEKEWNEEDGSIGVVVRMPIVEWRRLCKQEQDLIDFIV